MRTAVRVEGASQMPVLLYDGLCGFCDRTIRLILKVNRKGTIRFASLQGEFAASVLERHSSLKGIDSLVLVESGHLRGKEQVYVRSRAVLRIAWHLGGPWRAFVVFRIVPRPLLDWAYDVFARYRYQVFGRLDTCATPSLEENVRFLD
ncbi:MAG: DCC1-like thiol-disulfide oxidoreductase family protein [Longimicrobiales bacterium]|nr:DCC1-like thiol-disulfide oxidoreductase family protein [Longimicrobiales bacterium]